MGWLIASGQDGTMQLQWIRDDEKRSSMIANLTCHGFNDTFN